MSKQSVKSIEEIKADFGFIENIEDKYEYLIELGKELSDDSSIEKDANLVPGCMSKVWMKKSVSAGKINFQFSSDAMIIKGFLYIFLSMFDGAKKSEIDKINLAAFFEELGLSKNLSQKRLNGLNSVIKKIYN